MKVTIKDLAEKAGVSKTSVSFAFNNPGRISKETYDRIMAIAQEIGYSPDPVARILATKQTQTIGLLFPQSITEVLQNPYITEVVRGVGAFCDKVGQTLTILSPLKGIINHTIQNAAVDGMIILGVDKDSDVHQAFKKRHMPYVTIDADSKAEYVNVGINDEMMSEKLMDILLENNHKKICFCALKPNAVDISNNDHSTTIDARRNGIHNSIQKHKLSVNDQKDFCFVEIEASFVKSYELAKIQLSKGNRPTAVYCMGDIQAFGFYKAAKELGLEIPNDLSIVSFDDLPITEILYPSITAVHQPGYEKGYAAAELLMKEIAGEQCISLILQAEIKQGNSVGPAK